MSRHLVEALGWAWLGAGAGAALGLALGVWQAVMVVRSAGGGAAEWDVATLILVAETCAVAVLGAAIGGFTGLVGSAAKSQLPPQVRAALVVALAAALYLGIGAVATGDTNPNRQPLQTVP
ncbi:MAG: hypothetical protein AAB289_14610, partial [Chloroflexota bacterium]